MRASPGADPGEPRISVGLPVYNGGEFLERAVESLLRQTHTSFELVISDNCSTDHTERICREFAASDGRIRYSRNDRNIGAALNYNRVVDLARGEFFAWANHDDLWHPAYLERCEAALLRFPDAVVAYAHSELIDASGQTMVALRRGLDLDQDKPSDRLRRFYDLILDYDARGAWSDNDGEGLWIPVYGLMRKEWLRLTGLIGSYISSDTVLLEELLLLGKFVEVRDVLFYKREHAGRSTRASEAYDSRIVWFTGEGRSGRFLFPMWRIFLERMRKSLGAPLPIGQRLAASGAVLSYYVRNRHEYRTLVREMVINARRLVQSGERSPTTVGKW